MILSRTLAKTRIARGQRPGWLAAWGLVMVDFALVCAYAYAVYALLIGWIRTAQPDGFWVFAAFFLLIFVPAQAVLILSSLWAAKSRWQDSSEGQA
ncbi:hypothetical protein KUH32_07875 [Thalassococcus sp. CAU 1522]|uniref:Uncharacterized protein n=1 Tax=Thalassococcus arenae TaxID=2851652 RepID=A0ABS6N6P0_9RHOB|nr:hypothetical protein [Thalassococcus arenae]MBV2359688.1 hypothetical protein [Thalassococcus arenae]